MGASLLLSLRVTITQTDIHLMGFVAYSISGLLYLLMKVAESKSSSVVINIPKPCQLPVRQSSETSKWEYGKVYI